MRSLMNNLRRLTACLAVLSVTASALPAAYAAPADAVELTAGNTVSGSLDSAVDQDIYSLKLDKPGPVTIDLDGKGSGSWQAILEYDGVRYTQHGGQPSAVLGLDAGEYQIIVVSPRYSAADYSLTVTHNASENWETELNDGRLQADALPSGGVISGALTQRDDKDCFSFTLGSRQYMSVALMSDKTQSSGWAVSIYDASGKQVFAEIMDGSNRQSKLELSAGEYRAEVTAGGNYSSASYTLAVRQLDEAQVTRLGGSTRIGTAVEISKAGWSDGSAKAVVIANAYNFPDALAGETLASALDSPILLTAGKNALEQELIEEIRRLGADSAYILGGESVVCANIADELTAITGHAERLSGSDRYGTAVAIARKVQAIKGGVSTIYFASARNFPDALSISPVAALSGGIILYMPAEGGMDSATAEFAKSVNCSKAVIVGGTGAISAAGEKSIRSLGAVTERVGGTNRYDTSTKICSKFAYLFSGSGIAVASGTAFPDALAGGVFAARRTMPVVLVASPMPAEVRSYAASANPAAIFVFGGENAVPQAVADQLAQA